MLDKRSKRILLIFGLVVLLIIITEVTRPTPINWRPSYTAVDKIPFGSFVLYEELDAFFNEATVEKVEDDPYSFLTENSEVENAAYIFINDYIEFDQRQLEELQYFAEQGNTVFLSARYFSANVEDSLKLFTRIDYENFTAKIKPVFFNSAIKKDTTITFDKGVQKTTFTQIDTLNTIALGYVQTAKDPLDELNYIEIKYGEGKFLVHTLPEVFSNYYMLQNKETYTANVLSFIDADTILWDTYKKSGKRVITSPMRFVFSQKPLSWAYYVIAIGLILFVIFRAKRQQRIIKVVQPLANTSVEFTQTIGQMYFQHKDYGNISAKKINYFLEVVRSKYYLDTTELDAQFIEKLALKSGNSLETTKKLIENIKHQKSKAFHSEADLIELNKLMEAFRT